ncbi:MAG: DUF4333 domain-containing protein [Thermoleophilia bacterium]|nr:DUF4333 domain-containing protein [Thermoleophilia bacterium]
MVFARSSRSLFLMLSVLAAGVVLAGCSRTASIGANLTASQVEKVASSRLTDATGVNVDVTCTNDVKAKPGEVVYCTGVAEGTDGLVQDVRITVKSVDGSDAKFNVAILKKWPASDIQRTVSTTLAGQGIKGASITGCNEAQTIERGRSFICGLRGVDGTKRVKITFKDDDGAVSITSAK